MDWSDHTNFNSPLNLRAKLIEKQKNLTARKILHFDMDCFYAQVEMRDNPKLANVPLAIGGPPKSRSVLCTSNYIARKFNVRSAMPVDFALKLCPHLVILPPNFKKYSEISEEIFDIYREYSGSIETLSLDEAFIEIDPKENATLLAKTIKERILKKTELTSSAGVSYNKFIAKIASDWNKPNGLFVVPPEKAHDFLTKLEIKKLPGVGPKTNEILKKINLNTIEDLRNCEIETLQNQVGEFAYTLLEFAYGIDEREVISHSPPKSISVEETFIQDIKDLSNALNSFRELYPYLNKRLPHNDGQYFYKMIVKLKTHKFKRHSKEIVLDYYSYKEINQQTLMTDNLKIKAEELFAELFTKVNEPIRLLGVGFKLVPNDPYQQMYLPFQ